MSDYLKRSTRPSLVGAAGRRARAAHVYTNLNKTLIRLQPTIESQLKHSLITQKIEMTSPVASTCIEPRAGRATSAFRAAAAGKRPLK
jgi:hypothetical protein